MAAPAVGSSQANNGGGTQSQDVRIGAARQLADGSYSVISSTGAIWNYKSLTASGTTVVKTGAGQLHAIFCGTATGNLTLYDNTAASGTKIVDTYALVAGVTILDVSFGTGLTAVLSGAGVASVTYL
jgi:hypothetical protein